MAQVKNNPLVGMAAFVVVVAGMKAATSLVVPFLLATFLAIICTPFLFWIKKRGVPSLPAIVILLFLVFTVISLLAGLIGSSLADFSKNVPSYQENLKTMLGTCWGWLESKGVNLDMTLLDEIINPGKAMRVAANTLNGLGSVLTDTFLIILTFMFVLMEAATFPSKLKAIHKKSINPLENYAKIINGVNKYILIKTATSAITGLFISTWLMVQGVDYAVMWGVLAFTLNFIPNIGSIIAAVPAVLLSLVQYGVGTALTTALGFFLVNIVVGSILEPKIMGRDMGLSTLVVFISMMFWGWVLGPVGMLLSVPLTMTIKIILGGSEQNKWIAVLLGSNQEAVSETVVDIR